MSVTKLSATSYDGLFDVKINDWYFSIQWGLDADLDYLTEKNNYYKILSLINNNYELFENLNGYYKSTVEKYPRIKRV